MKIISIENSEAVGVSGTSLVGKITTTYDDLVKNFGKPTFRGGDNITSEWNLDFYVEDDEGEEDHIVATIYDWNMDSTPFGEHTWNIGGFFGKDTVEAVHAAMETTEPIQLSLDL
jgi:hypothetical protein